MGGKSKKGKQRVTDYYITAHYGICHGPVDEVLSITYGDKLLMEGSITANTAIAVSKPALFGGPTAEGGFSGTVDILLGGDEQLLPDAIAQSLQRNGAADTADPQQLPAYRGLCSFAIRGAGAGGAVIGANTAVVKDFRMRVRRAPSGVPFEPTITVDGMQLANPAAIIWECMTNGQWGMGGPAANLDADSFIAAAATLQAEGFGLGMLWHRQQKIEEFISDVLSHIEASLALDPFTGTFRLKLVRGDYDLEALPTFGPHNARLVDFARKGWGETINEINVSWTNPANEQSETVTVHDTANISLQGGVIVSETRDYYGIRTAELGLRVATRDLLVASSALATAELEVNREAWRVLPGDVIALEWPDYNIARMAMRVTHVDYGAPGQSTITLSLVEDVFSMPESAYVESSGSAWVSPARDPEALEHEHITSTPYYIAALTMGEADAEAVADTSDYDLIFGTHAATGIYSYTITHQIPTAQGDLVWETTGTVQPAGRATLLEGIAAEVSTAVAAFAVDAHPEHFVPGALLWLGPIDETGELALIASTDESGYTLTRGVLDTVPQEWDAGTPVWALQLEVLGTTGEERAVSETATVRLLANAAGGQLALEDAADVSATMSGRMHRPYRPGNLRVNGELLPDPTYQPTYPATITWAGRNRLMETAVLTAWDDASVTPEEGTEYRVLIEALEEDGTVRDTVADEVVATESYVLDESAIPPALADAPYMRITITAQRDGLDSWQSPSITFRGPLEGP